ncbi:Putative uncharacterized transposon-derived protein F52C9.6 [Eumeta japonica]|uniref:Uncharacterized transposon-derived protein F52C9.6 n=1 Tax=Eumeta variegata TaxID=151549 RepID=A0A4C1UD84_EUMVA|nr:Putative uncharacterized transposon-derived protein F52C9.6 [Eumeta japonica]
MKKIIMDSCILPTLTYSSQTWIFTNIIKNKIRSCQHAMERSILKLRRIDKKRNTDIRNKTKLVDELQHTMTLKWKWAGHIARYQDKRWTTQTTNWPGPSGKDIGTAKEKMGRRYCENRGEKLDNYCSKQAQLEEDGGGFYPNRGHTITLTFNIILLKHVNLSCKDK